MRLVVRLFTTWYKENRTDRRTEYASCLRQNLRSSFVSRVFVLDESGDTLLLNDRICLRSVQSRPTYTDFFAWINEVTDDADISILANTDIALDDNLRLLNEFSWPEETVMALSRWDVLEGGQARLFEHGDSQDCWLFRGKILRVSGNFPMGVYDCDNKIAWELQQAGYRVINPSLSLRTYHHHLSGYRSYEREPAPDYGIHPPFLYIEPDNLWGPFAAWSAKRRLGLDYLPWQMTAKRFWRYPVPAISRRAWRKGLRILRAGRK